jgi:glycosyltransferase involved in cell wall biosynthesis
VDLLFASDALTPPEGGAGMVMLEWIDGLRRRGHEIRIASLPAAERPAEEFYWRWRASQRAEMGRLVTAMLSERRPDLAVAQLHGAPAVHAAAAREGIPSVLVLPSYESLCKLAFDVGSGCRRDADCARCPEALGLSEVERAALLASRRAHAEALAGAAQLVVLSRAFARTVETWSGRRATVVYPVGPDLPAPAGASWDGSVLCAAARWSANKGADLLPSLVAACRRHGREVRVTEVGLTATQRAEIVSAGAALLRFGPIDELLAGSSLVLVPSLWQEPFGRIAWEALAHAVPVLASATGGLVEQVPSAMLVSQPGDAAAWAAGIDRLFGDELAWRKAADQCRPRAATLLDPAPLDVLDRLLREAALN